MAAFICRHPAPVPPDAAHRVGCRHFALSEVPPAFRLLLAAPLAAQTGHHQHLVQLTAKSRISLD